MRRIAPFALAGSCLLGVACLDLFPFDASQIPEAADANEAASSMTSSGDAETGTAPDGNTGGSGGSSTGSSGSSSSASSNGTSSGSSSGLSGSGSSSSGVACSGSSDAGIVSMQSCTQGGAGMTNCGLGGSGTESCCTSPEVQGGTYYRTYNMRDSLFAESDAGWDDLADPATVSSFSLDKYLVTVGRFRRFVTAWNNGCGWVPSEASGKHTHLNGGQGLANTAGGYEGGWDIEWNGDVAPTDTNLSSCAPYATWTNSVSTQENLPISCVNWYEAYAFCIWDGGFLPSEAEWEYAAAGGSQQRLYPWGWTLGYNADAIYECEYPSGSPASTCSGVVNIAPVGTASMGAGLWKQLDLAGDLFEWNLDGYQTPYVNPCTDCANLAPAEARITRGGAFNEGPSQMLPPYRGNYISPGDRLAATVGFRCARTP
jgi:sulfatase modifying factor 1